MVVCHLHLPAEREAAGLGDKRPALPKKHTVSINIFASVARSQYSHCCHSFRAALLKGGPCINIYFC